MDEPTDAELMMSRNVEMMNWENGYDVIIICCSSGEQARYWQRRLDDNRGTLIPSNCIVLAVKEDWPGGAGNALGTLYAYKNAVSLASERYGIEINELIRSGKISVGLYHTAGKGTRLAPLPGAENNNKPGVKLPATIKSAGKLVPMTILEAVIKQTGSYAQSRRGRLSVFWGDQVFLPTVPIEYTVTHHVDILCSLGPMPTEEEWVQKGMEKYGLIAVNPSGDAVQVDKVNYSTAVNILSALGSIAGVGVSLGSFSISSYMLFALLDEFQEELDQRNGKLDSDPHLWMPMTLQKDDYVRLMLQKDVLPEVSTQHYHRIQNFLKKFWQLETVQRSKTYQRRLFGAVTVGQNVFWWDYGLLKLYQRNALLLADKTNEAVLMRKFYGFSESSRIRDSYIIKTTIDTQSCISSCHLGTQESRQSCGRVQNSVLCNVRCKYIDVDGCILVNVTADRIYARPGCIIYNVIDESSEGLDLIHEQVLAGVFTDDGNQLVIRSNTKIDGGKAWKQELEWNPKTFEDIYNMNTNADPIKIERQSSDAHSDKWNSLISTSNQRSQRAAIQIDERESKERLEIERAVIQASHDYELLNSTRATSSFWSGFMIGSMTTLANVAIGSLFAWSWFAIYRRRTG